MNRKFLFFIMVGVMLIFHACYYDNLSALTHSSDLPGACNTTGVMTYSLSIAPILQANCGTGNSCHNSSNSNGNDLSSYAAVNAAVANGKLISSITWTGSASRMPQNGSQMNNCNIIKIQKWIATGAPNN